VHAFAQSAIGDWFYCFILIVFSVCLFTFFKQRDHLKTENKLESLVSRESSFLFNNLILLVACFTVLWGTLFPVLSEYVQGSKVTVGAPFYNRVNIPIGLFLLFLTGIGPLLAWRSTSLRSIRRNFILPTIAIFATALGLMLAGIRPWNDGDDIHATIFSLMAFSLAAGVITAIAAEFLRGAAVVRTQMGESVDFAESKSWIRFLGWRGRFILYIFRIVPSMAILIRRNTRRYGGYIIHFGIVVMFIGIAGGAFNQSREAEMGDGDSLSVGPYTLICRTITQDSNANYDTDFALLDAYRDGKFITQLAPEKRFYHASQTSATMVALHSTLSSDLYVVFEGRNPDTGRPEIMAHLNPLIAWIWIGVGIVVIGTFIALVPNMTRTGATRTPIESHTPVAAPPTPPVLTAAKARHV
jgi:cytochrome c-type biogenesis protein CcmF